ncbi:WD repeat-containing protein 36 [Aphelenchoides fujianensis]|nr:WD repeat-containing protein 36 [Aphelenchoides fujianensis]
MVLVPHRCVGQIFGHVPAVYYPIPTSANLGYLSVPINNCVYTYKIKPFRLAWISEPAATNVRVIARDKIRVFAADDDGVDVLNVNGTRVQRLLNDQLKTPVRFLIPMGEVLVCIEESGHINVVDIGDGSLLVDFETPSGFQIASAFHPATYFNKIVLGSTDGRLRIVNINTAKLVHEFQADASNFNCAVRCLVQSPAADIVACGMESGKIHLRNLRTGDLLLTLQQDGPVTAISFRTDGIETMVSTNAEGTITLWNLKEQSLVGQVVNAHSKAIYSAFFLLGQPNLITCGGDNRMVRWYMETEVSLPQMHKSIEGHDGEATALKFFTDTSVLTAGVDGCVRKFNIYRSDMIVRLGVAREVRKGEVSSDRFMDVRLSPIVGMAQENMREHVWENVACLHRDSPIVSTWSNRRYTKGKHLFVHDRFTKDERFLDARATAVEITNSGDLCLVGYSSGHVDVYNMQSGKFRYSLPNPKLKGLKKTDAMAHGARVIAAFSNMNSKDVITIDAAGMVVWWQLEAAPKCVRYARCAKAIQCATFHRESRLLAVGVADGGDVKVYDGETGTLARVFPQIVRYGGEFTALEFSPDSHHLLVADTSCFIRLIDVRTGQLCGSVRCSNVCTRASFSFNGLYVATCHREQSEIFVWTNTLKYSGTRGHVVADEKLPVHTLSSFTAGVVDDAAVFELSDEEEDDDDDICVARMVKKVVIDDSDEDESSAIESVDIDNVSVGQTPVGDEEGVHTLSGEPAHRWATLPYIDVIKKRNTIKEVVKTVTDVPFFLESTPNENEIIVDAEPNRKLAAADRTDDEVWTDWSQQLSRAGIAGDFLVCFRRLTAKPTTQIDFEIRSLPTRLLPAFLKMLMLQLETRTLVDFVHSILCTFVRVQRKFLSTAHLHAARNEERENEEQPVEMNAAPDLDAQMERLRVQLVDSTEGVEFTYNEIMPVLKWIKSAVI